MHIFNRFDDIYLVSPQESKYPCVKCFYLLLFSRKLKVVICGKYKNLKKITKFLDISLKFQTSSLNILCSLQCKIEGHAV